MRLEQIDRRVLAALRFVDANTGQQIQGPMTVKSDGLDASDIPDPAFKIFRNRSDYHIIASASGFREYTRAFDPITSAPAVESRNIHIRVSSPTGHYFPRRYTLQLPLDPTPPVPGEIPPLLRAVDVPLYATPKAEIGAGQAAVRVTVLAAGPENRRLGAALVRVVRQEDSQVLARGLTAWQGTSAGEAMVVVPDIPVTTFSPGNGAGGGAVIVQETLVTVEAVFDTAFDVAGNALPNPENLEANRTLLQQGSAPLELRYGETRPVTVRVPLN